MNGTSHTSIRLLALIATAGLLGGCFSQSDEDAFVSKCTQADDTQSACTCGFRLAKSELAPSEFKVMMSSIRGKSNSAQQQTKNMSGMGQIGMVFKALGLIAAVRSRCGVKHFRF